MLRAPRKTFSSKGENDGLPGSIIAMGEGSVNRLCPSVSLATAWFDLVERGYRADGICRTVPDQCSARPAVGSRGTNRVSASTRMVSGWQPEKREETPRDRGQDLFCSLV